MEFKDCGRNIVHVIDIEGASCGKLHYLLLFFKFNLFTFIKLTKTFST